MSRCVPRLADSDNCTGCGACRNACSISAIRMQHDIEGFLQPVINTELCVGCKKCEVVCPILHYGRCLPHQLSDKPILCGLIRDEAVWRNSSSGGAFTGLCSVFAGGNAIIYGAKFENLSTVVHARVEGVANIMELRKSKYVQSDVRDMYAWVKDDLEGGRQVIFSGTPCQIAGLRGFLGKEYDRLLCVEVICHGVGSPKVFASCLSEYERKVKRKLVSYAFRTKLSWPNKSVYTSAYTSVDGSIEEIGGDVYNRLFCRQLILRKSCMENCRYRTADRYADITIADARKEREINPNIADGKNRSVIIANTIKGKVVVEQLDSVMDLLPYNMELLSRTNPLYFRTTSGSKNRDVFFDKFLNGESLIVLANRFAPDHSRGMKLLIIKVVRKVLRMIGLK